jgi:hypothetical protein
MEEWEMNMTLKGCIAIALTLGLQSVCFADSVSSTTTTTEGPPVVLDSYMKPTVVRERDQVDAAGNTEKTVEPIIQERHEHVMLPASQTTSTVTEHDAAVQTVKTESQTAQRTYRSAAKPRIAHRIRHHYRACAAVKHPAAVAQKVTIENKVIQPAVTERQDTTVTKSTVFERKDPALDQE